MERAEQKIIQFLVEAHTSELTMAQSLQGSIAAAPAGTYRRSLEQHLQETCEHARRVELRLAELGHGRNRLQEGIGRVQDTLSQVLSISRSPLDLMRPAPSPERLLKGAKDQCASEGLEIANYAAIERLARAASDHKTRRLAASIRADEERMLATLLRQIPELSEAVADGAGLPPVRDGANRPRAPRTPATRATRKAPEGTAPRRDSTRSV